MTASERENLILEHLPRVTWVASRIHDKISWTATLDDLVSIGVLGLITAVDRYDPGYEVQFKTYAEYKIRGAILDSLRGADGIPAHKRALAKRLERVAMDVRQELGRPATEEEIAQAAGIPVPEYRELVQSTRAIRLRSLDAVQEIDGTPVRLSEIIPDRSGVPPYVRLEQSQLRSLLESGLALLPEAQRIVVTLYFFEGKSQREIADRLSVHVSRVSQLKNKGLERLRGYMRTRWFRDTGVHRPFRALAPSGVGALS